MPAPGSKRLEQLLNLLVLRELRPQLGQLVELGLGAGLVAGLDQDLGQVELVGRLVGLVADQLTLHVQRLVESLLVGQHRGVGVAQRTIFGLELEAALRQFTGARLAELAAQPGHIVDEGDGIGAALEQGFVARQRAVQLAASQHHIGGGDGKGGVLRMRGLPLRLKGKRLVTLLGRQQQREQARRRVGRLGQRSGPAQRGDGRVRALAACLDVRLGNQRKGLLRILLLALTKRGQGLVDPPLAGRQLDQQALRRHRGRLGLEGALDLALGASKVLVLDAQLRQAQPARGPGRRQRRELGIGLGGLALVARGGLGAGQPFQQLRVQRQRGGGLLRRLSGTGRVALAQLVVDQRHTQAGLGRLGTHGAGQHLGDTLDRRTGPHQQLGERQTGLRRTLLGRDESLHAFDRRVAAVGLQVDRGQAEHGGQVAGVGLQRRLEGGLGGRRVLARQQDAPTQPVRHRAALHLRRQLVHRRQRPGQVAAASQSVDQHQVVVAAVDILGGDVAQLVQRRVRLSLVGSARAATVAGDGRERQCGAGLGVVRP
mmetsp:Transcript_49004/g.115073  ORF Transcript_49004/g.115073 Transcript_49004/m.115073 type:complete len:543 (-) Transcript_49004:1551-3179(-)